MVIFKNVHSPTLCPKGTKKSSKLQSSPKCWHDISSINIYKPPRYIPPNCWHDISNTNIYKYNWHVFLKSEYKYKYHKIYICIGYILPKIRKIYVSWRVSVNPLGAGLGNVHFEITFCTWYKLPTFWEYNSVEIIHQRVSVRLRTLGVGFRNVHF